MLRTFQKRNKWSHGPFTDTNKEHVSSFGIAISSFTTHLKAVLARLRFDDNLKCQAKAPEDKHPKFPLP
jgi:hypothetical protein